MFSGPFFCSLWWPVLTPYFYRSISGSKRFLIGCPIKDNQESYSHLSANPSSRPYLTGTEKTLLRCFDQWEQYWGWTKNSQPHPTGWTIPSSPLFIIKSPFWHWSSKQGPEKYAAWNDPSYHYDQQMQLSKWKLNKTRWPSKPKTSVPHLTDPQKQSTSSPRSIQALNKKIIILRIPLFLRYTLNFIYIFQFLYIN